jgi:NAD+ kinase
MSTITAQSRLSPGPEEVFSTPPTTPGVELNRTISRRSSRPTSLHIDQRQNAGWKPDIILDTSSPVTNTNGTQVPPDVDNSETIIPDNTSSVNHHKSRALMNSPPINSPCFVHSHLDKGASLTDWLRTRTGASQPIADDLGVARSLQHSTAPKPYIPHGYPSLIETKADQAVNGESDAEEDEFVGSLTKQLAETAVGVREMSKQLGMVYRRCRCTHSHPSSQGRARVQSNIQNVLIITKARDNRLIKLTRELALYLMLKRRPTTKRGLVVYVFPAIGLWVDVF